MSYNSYLVNMKGFLLLIISLPLCFNAFGQTDSLGFTNKGEAKNLKVHGKKEGKWIEYEGIHDDIIEDTNIACGYILTIYRKGKPNGIVREYSKDGILGYYEYYLNGKEDGICRVYSDDGSIILEQYYSNGKLNGMAKDYKNGKLESETPFTMDKANGIKKEYYESGKVKTETTYKNNKIIAIKNYDENGNEIK